MKRWIALVVLLVMAAAAAAAWKYSHREASPADISGASDLGLMLVDTDKGVSVLAVQARSIAEQTDICPGDLLLTINGNDLSTAEMLDQMLSERVREELLIGLQRGKEVFEVNIPLERIVH